jgi:phosphoribosylamine--glycine ligase
MNERVIIIGKGAREHALAYRLSRDAENKVVREVVVTPGNDGMAFSIPCIRPDTPDIRGCIELAKKLKPALIVIGPEDALAAGYSDALRAEGFAVFGPSRKATQIEASKSFMKELALVAKIPTAGFATFENIERALAHLESARFPIVVKADGLCAGKGVVVAQSLNQARAAVRNLIAMGPIVIEKFLQGVEMSAIALCTEDDAILFPPVRDHKRLLDNDEGPNTGGMGVIGPLPQASNAEFMNKLKETIFMPALAYMRQAGTPFTGALFAGLMVDGDDVRLLEFNARFGDPETQALMYGIDVDLFPILLSIAKGEKLDEGAQDALARMHPTTVVTMAAQGYPEMVKTGDVIKISEQNDGMIFMAGVSRNHSGQLICGGGRVLSCVARAESLMMAIHKSYDIVARVSFNGAQYRTDIGRTFL